MTLGVLLVDDNPIQAATRRIILERSGLPVTVAENGRQALDVFAREPSLIGMMVTDHLMPEMNGPELVRKLREQSSTLPILVLSGLPDAELDYTDLNIVFRLKPLPPENLIALTHEMLGLPVRRTA